MSVGLPIACSSKSSLPEVLGDAGVFFDPEDVNSISSAVETLLIESELRMDLAKKAKTCRRIYMAEMCKGNI